MKNIVLKFTGLVAGIALFLVACEPNKLELPFGEAGEGARVRFVQAAANINDASGNAMRMSIFINGKPVNGTQNLAFAGGTFPNVGYTILPGGATEFSFNRSIFNIPRIVAGKRDTVFYTDSTYMKGNFNFENGKYYTVYMTDTVPTLGFKVVELNANKNLTDTFSYINLTHMLTKPGQKYDTIELVRRRDSSVMISGITYGTTSPFVQTIANRTDTFFIRKVGTKPSMANNTVILTGTRGRSYYTAAVGNVRVLTTTRLVIGQNQ
jgi:hypothetical protein